MIWAILYLGLVAVVLWFGHQHELAAHDVEPRDNQSNNVSDQSHGERFK